MDPCGWIKDGITWIVEFKGNDAWILPNGSRIKRRNRSIIFIEIEIIIWRYGVVVWSNAGV
ncbi:hypothetical protein WN51_03427 [Melipona quadrifasciata]|uniref:Uncharacterized protein n=1 Tax=Melipona quadrifasciata TaxID=166423 RepID=A0A0M9ADW2_9HYME|nr:hypothetical protein WN51_03427 [Melipona quadrifasciata]